MMSELDVDEIMAEACRLAHAGVRGQHSNSKIVRLCAEIRTARTDRDSLAAKLESLGVAMIRPTEVAQ